jgi:GT2 family glycosyltransferase/SAM-dependent methyltransferase
MPGLIAVVLNWNGGEDTARALESLAGIETICVDNGSTDGSDREIEQRFPGVELIRNGSNLGFAGGNNIGIRRALEHGADWVLLLNNDAVAAPGIERALALAAAARPDAGLIACKVYLYDDVLEYAGASFNALLGYSRRMNGYGARDDGRWDSLLDVDRADGAAMAMSRIAIEQVGALDESLFAYVEDVDWSLRIRAAGFAMIFAPDAKVWHRGSRSTGGKASTSNLYYSVRNTLLVCERYRPLPMGLRALRRAVIVGTHLAQAARHPTRAAAAGAVLAGRRDFRRSRFGQRERQSPSAPTLLRRDPGLWLLLHLRPPGDYKGDRHGRCSVCGTDTRFVRNSWVLPRDLARVVPAGFADRESQLCAACGSSLRVRVLADVLLEHYAGEARSIAELVEEERFSLLDIAEINSIGRMHPFLALLPRLTYSEYPEQNIQELTYPDASFDLVLTSETLEHIPDVPRALAEIRRVLRPGGRHVFTVPLDPRLELTRSREGMAPIHHGRGGGPYALATRRYDMLAYTDFGLDVPDLLREASFDPEVHGSGLETVYCAVAR